ncbi:MAG: DUF2721 domain-containing protein, partial [Verrucomicrobiota bacterium]
MVSEVAASNPFALLTLIVAPAVLTNAMSVLALSTSNRFLRAGERLRVLAAEVAAASEPEERAWRLRHVNRIERQAVLLLAALRAEYVALGSFITASLISIVGAGLSAAAHPAARLMIALALVVGFVGAGTLVCGWAQRVLDELAVLVDGVEVLRHERSGNLTVAASLTVAEHLLPAWIGDLRQRRPELRVGLQVMNSARVCELV